MHQFIESYGVLNWGLPILIVSLGGFMRGFAGFGATLIMVPLLSLLMPPSEAVFIALSVDTLVMAPMFPRATKQAEWNLIMPLAVGSFLATPFGVWFLVITSPDTLRVIISSLIIISALFLLSGWTHKGNRSFFFSFSIGVFSGTTNSAAGIGGPPIAAYFVAKGLSPVRLRASLNSIAFFMEGVSAMTIYFASDFKMSNLITVFILLPFMSLTAILGSTLFKKFDNKIFNKLILYFLILFGLYIILVTLRLT
ncbi:MAG: hypothetical protein CMM67_04320 [Rhodospirillaceae bacterium]|nr:hypothetical protein [Rhodospirillaceae bacterium]OUT79411.1 MAG: hypothetical protein CBB83_04505 [Rhodospirillaceae bacterium TMED23]